MAELIRLRSMWNDLNFEESITLIYSTKDGRPINWDTGEGISWIRCSKEDIALLNFFDLDWKECS